MVLKKPILGLTLFYEITHMSFPSFCSLLIEQKGFIGFVRLLVRYNHLFSYSILAKGKRIL